MREEIIYQMESPFRDTFRVRAFCFGSGAKSLAIVGSMRGDEIQQQYICAQLVRVLTQLEEEGNLLEGHQIMVIPSVNPFSMNIEKRFWAMDNTDINRMFPGYDQGETTQRIAAALFKAIEGYTYGVQLASFYMPGEFTPHVRMLQTGYEAVESAALFGLPYICLRRPLPFDTALLNYNWQIWQTKAFSLYAGHDKHIDANTTRLMLDALLRFMKRTGMIHYRPKTPAYTSEILDEAELITLKATQAGIVRLQHHAGEAVQRGEILAYIIDAYNGKVVVEVTAPEDGVIFFNHNKPLALQNTPLFKLIRY